MELPIAELLGLSPMGRSCRHARSCDPWVEARYAAHAEAEERIAPVASSTSSRIAVAPPPFSVARIAPKGEPGRIPYWQQPLRKPVTLGHAAAPTSTPETAQPETAQGAPLPAASALDPQQPQAAPADNDACQDTEPNPIPPSWAIRIATGREAMQGRDLRLYFAIATCAGLTLMEMRGVGDPILVDKSLVSAICDAYMASNELYQREVAAHRAGEPVDIHVEFRRAFDRARKEITRAMGDLVEIYAADVVADEKTGKVVHLVYRLPDVRRRQIEHNAKSVYARPGGGRMLVDDWGLDVGR